MRRIALVLLGVLWVMTGSAVAAEGETVRLGIEALESEKPYFDFDLEPGASKQLTVRFTNYGEAETTVAVYATDVFSLRGGGLGLHPIEEPQTGATRWLDFQSARIDLLPGEAVDHTFIVTVPGDAEPGDYITSIVMQNADPVAVSSSDDAQRFTQTVRHGIAVAIDVPGPRNPQLVAGDVSHDAASGRSVILFDIDNAGNTHLKPAGMLSLFDADGESLFELSVQMDSVYAGTQTRLEVILDQQLQPGEYYASLSLEDEQTGASTVVDRVLLYIPHPEPSPEAEPGVTGLLQRSQDNSAAGGVEVRYWTAGVIAALAALGTLVAFTIWQRRRRSIEPGLTDDASRGKPSTSSNHVRRPTASADGRRGMARERHASPDNRRIRQLVPPKAPQAG